MMKVNEKPLFESYRKLSNKRSQKLKTKQWELSKRKKLIIENQRNKG
ncbi:hypothetical protein HNR44_002655 [Geomicrobium halophilum]|uniref:Uncharacterized protein n=1 Tax=Geomicrobium halophilum TaxID=549000 RepID=A0A841Q0E3_9BACL|nr:hypothetical protein [Geomicrobium halophilum]MBB6450665.1 hypothetical protein [Geomicrobium halophilum]